MAIYGREIVANTVNRIVEYATREQAQNAVNSLSNQSLMGRLVYVREVRRYHNSGEELEDAGPGLTLPIAGS
jgi:hypothetical protein